MLVLLMYNDSLGCSRLPTTCTQISLRHEKRNVDSLLSVMTPSLDLKQNQPSIGLAEPDVCKLLLAACACKLLAWKTNSFVAFLSFSFILVMTKPFFSPLCSDASSTAQTHILLALGQGTR